MNFYIDFEATQFSERIISIGCTNDNGEVFGTLVKPSKNEKINNFITDLTGITQEMIDTAPSADNAFFNFFEWMKKVSDGSDPIFFCYGKADKLFIERTVHHMKDLFSISFANLIKETLIDYSEFVKNFFNSNSDIALKRVYSFMKEQEQEQKHDAIEDALMLQYIAEHLDGEYKIEDLPPCKSHPHKESPKVPEVFLSWENSSMYSADTLANKENWKIKASTKNRKKYFNNINTAVLWAIKYLVKGKSPKKRADIRLIENTIKESIIKGKPFLGFIWEERN